MKHLLICREYPPAPSGGIGSYAHNLSELLAEAGETVHVIGQMWERAEAEVEERRHGRLIIHRAPFEDWASLLPRHPHPALNREEEKSLFKSPFPAQCFSWKASLIAEELVEKEGIDIIEAPDYEAPLYYFQLRRALGRGPERKPPCLVHLHSPTEFIARHNDWDMSLPGAQTAKRLEDYSIAAADALLCPSRYLARQAEAHYGLAGRTVQVIPYPLGESRLIERDSLTWANGAICYAGRLEPRKGVAEWVDAAVAVADEYPTARFEFVGADTLDAQGNSVRAWMERRIPKHLKMRFCFRSEVKRTSLPQFLARSRVAVVPSRWENFPNTCIEAMGSGLPVIASREGGMVEMIEDGRTGWLAPKPSCDGFAEALKRALETPPTKIAEMGREAASDIRYICDNKRIVEKQIDFRDEIVRQGARRSLRLPVNLPWARRPLSDETTRRRPEKSLAKGVAIVVTCFNSGQYLDQCLQSLRRQVQRPVSVVVVDDGSTEERTLKALNQARREGWQVVRKGNEGSVSAKNAGINAVLSSGIDPIGFAFLSTQDRLESVFVDVCEKVLQRRPEVGLVSGWARHSRADSWGWITPCPSFPYQWVSNEAAPFSVVRTEALTEAGYFRTAINYRYDDWDLVNAVMAAGWIPVTVPEVLARCRVRRNKTPDLANVNGHEKARKELLERFPDLVARDAKEIALLYESATARSEAREALFLRERLAMARVIIQYPREPALLVLGRLKNKLLRHAPVWVASIISRGSNLAP